MDYITDIEPKMKMWRIGAIPMPKEYVAYHQQLAEAALQHLPVEIIVHRRYMDNDGWGDGMRTLHLIAEYRGELLKIKWHDSHATGQWMYACKGGGWALLHTGRKS